MFCIWYTILKFSTKCQYYFENWSNGCMPSKSNVPYIWNLGMQVNNRYIVFLFPKISLINTLLKSWKFRFKVLAQWNARTQVLEEGRCLRSRLGKQILLLLNAQVLNIRFDLNGSHTCTFRTFDCGLLVNLYQVYLHVQLWCLLIYQLNAVSSYLISLFWVFSVIAD